jgi:hypothetical protein
MLNVLVGRNFALYLLINYATQLQLTSTYLLHACVPVLKPSPSTSTAGPSNAIPSTSQQAPTQQGHVVANTSTLQTQNRPTVLLTVPPGGRVPGNIVRTLVPIPDHLRYMIPRTGNVQNIFIPQGGPTIRIAAPQGAFALDVNPYLIRNNAQLAQNIPINRGINTPGVNSNNAQVNRASVNGLAPQSVQTNRGPAPANPAILGGARQRGGVRSGRGGAVAARRHAQGPGPRHNIPAPNTAARNQPIVRAQAVPPVAEEIEVIDERL